MFRVRRVYHTLTHFDVSRNTVWFSALSLAFGALSAAVPVSSLGTGVAIAVCFEPEEDCTAFAVDAIDRAETQILVHASRPQNLSLTPYNPH
jgi:hypothetical protein